MEVFMGYVQGKRHDFVKQNAVNKFVNEEIVLA